MAHAMVEPSATAPANVQPTTLDRIARRHAEPSRVSFAAVMVSASTMKALLSPRSASAIVTQPMAIGQGSTAMTVCMAFTAPCALILAQSVEKTIAYVLATDYAALACLDLETAPAHTAGPAQDAIRRVGGARRILAMAMDNA